MIDSHVQSACTALGSKMSDLLLRSSSYSQVVVIFQLTKTRNIKPDFIILEEMRFLTWF